MADSKGISSWLVLGPIYRTQDQAEPHYPGDGHPMAAAIIMDIDANAFDPLELTRRVENAPQEGDTARYGNGKLFPPKTYAWRALSFSNLNWENIDAIGDDIHLNLGLGVLSTDPQDPESFAGKHHSLALFLVYIISPDARNTKLCIRSDDSIRVWLNGEEIEPLRYAGERDVGDRLPTEHPEETCADINLRSGTNVLMTAVAETHVEWAVSVRIVNDDGLSITPTKPENGGSVMSDSKLTNSQRRLYKGTYRPLTNVPRGGNGRFLEKLAFLHGLDIRPHEFAQLESGTVAQAQKPLIEAMKDLAVNVSFATMRQYGPLLGILVRKS